MDKATVEPKLFLEDFFFKLKKNEDKMLDINIKIQYDFMSDNNGKWYVIIENGKALGVVEGTIENPACTFIAKYANFYNAFTGKINVTSAFMTGKIKLKGDMGIAMKLQQWAS